MCTVSRWALSRTSVHSLHPYFRCCLVFLRVKECVVKVPFPFGGLSSVLETLMGAGSAGTALSSCSSIGLSVSKGGSRTAGMPVEVSYASTHQQVVCFWSSFIWVFCQYHWKECLHCSQCQCWHYVVVYFFCAAAVLVLI